MIPQQTSLARGLGWPRILPQPRKLKLVNDLRLAPGLVIGFAIDHDGECRKATLMLRGRDRLLQLIRV